MGEKIFREKKIAKKNFDTDEVHLQLLCDSDSLNIGYAINTSDVSKEAGAAISASFELLFDVLLLFFDRLHVVAHFSEKMCTIIT